MLAWQQISGGIMFRVLVLLLVSVIFIIITAMFTMTSTLARWAFANTFETQQLTLSDDLEIVINPFDGKLSLKNVAVLHQQSKALVEFNDFSTQVQLASLFSEQIVINHVSIEGLKLQIEKNEQQVLLGGYDLNQLKNTTSSVNANGQEPIAATPANQKAEASKIDSILVNDFEFRNSQFEYIDLTQTSSITLANWAFSNLNIQLATDNTKIKLPEMNIELADLAVNLVQPLLSVELQSINLDVSNSEISIGAQDPGLLSVDTTLSMDLSALKVENQNAEAVILAVNEIRLSPTQLALNQDNNGLEYQLQSSQLAFNKINAMYKQESPESSLADISEFLINDWRVDNETISVQELAVAESTINVTISNDKQLENLYLPQTQPQADSNEQAAPETQPVETDAIAQPAMKFQVASIVNSGPITINTLDKSVVPNFASNLEIKKLEIRDLDSINTNYVTTIAIQATNNDYAQIVVDAKSQLFVPSPWHEFNIKLDEIELVSVSPYVSSALGYHITSGQLDTTVKGSIKDDKIDGNADLLLRSVDLSAIEESGEKKAFSSGALSFNYALSLLKDSDGHVELEVPFQGDLNNPSVGFSGFLSLIVKRATMSAAKDYLINAFVPYANIVSFAMSAGQEALKMRFKDFEFAPGQDALTEQQFETLDKLAEVLKQYPAITVKLCPISMPQDLNTEQTEHDKAKQLQILRDLANRRAILVKQYLVKPGGVESKRLLSCVATIDNGDSAKPRIEFSQL